MCHAAAGRAIARFSRWSDCSSRAPSAGGGGSSRRQPEETEEQQLVRRREAVISLARRGLPSQAVKHATSLGLAPDTPATEAIMRSKFIAPPDSQATSRRVPAPEQNELQVEGVVKAILSFKRGVAPGPSGQRPDFYKQIVGESGARPGAVLLTGLCNLLASGRAPPELRPYLGGARGTALRKAAKDGSDDARPVCSGEAIRRIIGKAALAIE